VDEKIGALLGKAGVTYTPLHPAGVAIIEGRKVDVVTPGHFIEQNVPIRVVDISGNRVVVREVSLSVEGKSP
jgi:membrane-bound serine protease (ClpP class)